MLKKILLATCAAAAFSAPAGAASFMTGDIFAGIASGYVAHYRYDGTFLENLYNGSGGYTTGMAFDGAGNLYSTNFSLGSITRYDTNGAVLGPNPYSTGMTSPESIAFNTAGQYFVGQAGGHVQLHAADGSLIQTFSMPQNTDWIDLASDQTTLFYNDEGGTIRKWDVSTDTSLGDFANNLSNGGSNSFALRILSNGNVLSAAGSLVTEYDSAGNFLGSYDVTGVDNFFALNLDPDGTHFWSGSYGNNTLYRFSIGGFGADAADRSLYTGGQLFGVALAGELTAGGPPPPPNGVPEPTTWALMILGFGAVGGALRRRKPRMTLSYS